MRKYINIIIIVFCFLIIVLSIIIPGPASLSENAKKCFGVFIAAVILWVTQALPLSVTSLLVIGLLSLLNVMDPDELMASFGNKSIFFIIGAFIISASIMKTGLSKRLAAYLLRFFGFKNRPFILVIGVMVTAAFLSCFMPEHAVVTFMFPIVLEIAIVMGLVKGKSNFGKILFLSLAWGAIIGGVTTFLGGARNPLAIGVLFNRYGLNIGFFEWMIPVLPVVVVLLILAPLILLLFYGKKSEKVDLDSAHALLKETVKDLGPVNRKEFTAVIILIITIFSWIFLSKYIGLATIAILSGASMFIFRVIEWEDVQNYVNWGVIIMYGGAIVLGKALTHTKGIEWISNLIISNTSFSKFHMLAIIALVSIVLTEGISNVAVVAMVLPLAYGIGDALGINPIAVTYSVAIPAGLAFSLPIGTPPNAICYSSGYYKVSESLRAGIIMNFLSWLIFIIFAYFYWPLIGLNL